MRTGDGPLALEWTWPWGVIGVLAVTLLWMMFEGATAWLWLPLAFLFGVYVAWRTWSYGRRILGSA